MGRYVRVAGEVLLVAGVLFALGYLGGADQAITGFLTFEKEVSLSIAEDVDGEISRFDFTQFIEIGESVTIDLELRNTGSVPVEASEQIEVYDVNNTLLHTYPGPDYELDPGEARGRSVRHTPHEPETYIVRANAEIGGADLQTAKFLVVQEEPEPEPPEPPVIVRRRINWIFPDPPPEPTPAWTVEDPEQVTVEQNGTATAAIRITNTGDALLRNIRPTLATPSDITVSYEPGIIFGIPPNATRNVVLTVNATPDATGNHTVQYEVASEELEARGQFPVRVEPAVTRTQIRDEITQLRRLVQDARSEIAAADEMGIRTDDVAADVDEAAAILETAVEQVDQGDLAAAQTSAQEARALLDDAFLTLFQRRGDQITVEAPLIRPVHYLLLVAVLAAVLLVGAYYYVRERHKRRPKLLRDLEEE